MKIELYRYLPGYYLTIKNNRDKLELRVVIYPEINFFYRYNLRQVDDFTPYSKNKLLTSLERFLEL